MCLTRNFGMYAIQQEKVPQKIMSAFCKSRNLYFHQKSQTPVAVSVLLDIENKIET